VATRLLPVEGLPKLGQFGGAELGQNLGDRLVQLFKDEGALNFWEVGGWRRSHFLYFISEKLYAKSILSLIYRKQGIFNRVYWIGAAYGASRGVFCFSKVCAAET
jgi:hypothetical protein